MELVFSFLCHDDKICLNYVAILVFNEILAYVVLGILNANRKIRKRTDTDVAFTREYSRVSIFHRERECTN